MNLEYPRESVEVVRQANTSVMYLELHTKILTKAIENQKGDPYLGGDSPIRDNLFKFRTEVNFFIKNQFTLMSELK